MLSSMRVSSSQHSSPLPQITSGSSIAASTKSNRDSAGEEEGECRICTGEVHFSIFSTAYLAGRMQVGGQHLGDFTQASNTCVHLSYAIGVVLSFVFSPPPLCCALCDLLLHTPVPPLCLTIEFISRRLALHLVAT